MPRLSRGQPRGAEAGWAHRRLMQRFSGLQWMDACLRFSLVHKQIHCYLAIQSTWRYIVNKICSTTSARGRLVSQEVTFQWCGLDSNIAARREYSMNISVLLIGAPSLQSSRALELKLPNYQWTTKPPLASQFAFSESNFLPLLQFLTFS